MRILMRCQFFFSELYSCFQEINTTAKNNKLILISKENRGVLWIFSLRNFIIKDKQRCISIDHDTIRKLDVILHKRGT